MMRLLNIAITGLAIICLFACSSVKVLNTEAANSFDLSDYRTYGFYNIEANGDTVSQVFKDRIELLKNEIARKLDDLGLVRSSSQPDLLVNLGIVVEEKVQTRQTDFRTDAPRYIGQRHYSWKSEEVEVNRYKKGTVSVHLVDRQQNELMWQGAAEGVVPDNINKLRKTIKEGVDKLFSHIPISSR